MYDWKGSDIEAASYKTWRLNEWNRRDHATFPCFVMADNCMVVTDGITAKILVPNGAHYKGVPLYCMFWQEWVTLSVARHGSPPYLWENTLALNDAKHEMDHWICDVEPKQYHCKNKVVMLVKHLFTTIVGFAFWCKFYERNAGKDSCNGSLLTPT